MQLLTNCDDIIPNDNYTQKSLVNTEVIQTTSNSICIYCNLNHKFSPFNISESIRLDIKQPILRKNEDIFYTDISVNPDITIYKPINNKQIEENKIEINDTVYWGNGIELFKTDGLLILLSKNLDKIDDNTIKGLLKFIYCPKWWNNLYFNIDKYNFIVDESNYIYNNDLLNKIITYHKLIIESKREILTTYNFNNYNILIKKLGELIKRYNERKYEDNNIQNLLNKENEKNIKISKELEYLKKLEEDEINNIKINIDNFETFETKFKLSINKIRKSNNIKFLATINPNEQIIADMIIKLGECSKLNIGVNNIDKLKKISIWEYYIKQQENIKQGKKFKREKGKKKEDIPSDPNILLELTTSQLIQYKNIYDENLLELKKNKDNITDFVLDDWQNEAINYIRTGKSCLIKGPTSGGKTYTMMKGLDNIINKKIEHNVVYVSPTFHLAYQTYANVKATFPNRKIAIITIELIHIPKDTNIFIGTACELLNYFITTDKKFHVGIFDEIHVATTLYCDNISTKDKIRARAYAKLISRCENQVIAASATIRNVDAMRNFIASMINLDNNNKIKYDEIHVVNYEKRIIPLIEYRFINNNKLEIIKRDNNNIEIEVPSIEDIKGDINSKNLFKLLVEMRNNNMIPSIVFDNTDDEAWRTYLNLIEYCDKSENKDYKDYNEGLNLINNIITSYNLEYYKINNNVSEDDNLDINSRIKTKRGGSLNLKNNKCTKRDSVLRSILNKRNNIIIKMITEYKIILKRSIISYNNHNIESICKIINISNTNIINILELFGTNRENLYKKFPNFYIIQAHIDMFEVLDRLNSLDRDIPDVLMLFEINRGSYYRFSKSSSIELLKAIREPGNNEENWKQRKRMISLAEAQNIKPKDIDSIIDVIMKGLQFGLAIINPSLPFVIQNIILENLKSKELGIVFASESMSMGINYPLRSVVIKSISGYERLLPGKMIQMSGRCGRRGKDDQAHVVFWGIENASESNHVYIPPIVFPEHFVIDDINTKSGCIISDHEILAVKLGEILITKNFDDEITIINNIKKDYDDYDNFDIKEFKLLEKKKSNNEIKRQIFLKPVIECITQHIEYTNDKIDDLASMICKIDEDIIIDSFFVNSFEKSQSINLLLNMMIELYNYYASCSNIDFLNFIEKIVNILQKCEYKLIKLGSGTNLSSMV
jgi:hypothetical protein